MLDKYADEIDSKCLLLVARVNDAVGDPALGIYQRVVKDNRYYLPAYSALRKAMHAKGHVVDDEEDDKEIYDDWNNTALSNAEWVEKYAATVSSKAFSELRQKLLKLAYE